MEKNLTDFQIIEALKKPFPPEAEEKLKIKGTTLTYLSVESIRKRLEEVVGLDWSWQTLETTYSHFQKPPKKENIDGQWKVPEGAQPEIIPSVIITGRLSILLPSGKLVTRDGNGGSSLDKGTGPGDPEKIAASDAFKRAAWFFGIGAYLRDLPQEKPSYKKYNNSYNSFNNNGSNNSSGFNKPSGGGLIPGLS